jgi:talin
MPVENGSTPQDVVKAAREVIQSGADMYFAENADAAVAAAQKAFVSVQDLVGAGNAAKKLSDSSEVQRNISDALQGVGKSMVKMLEDGKRNHEDDEVKQALETDSELITASVNELIVALKKLPNTENITLEEKASLDLDAMAEQELLKCAQIIAEAARTLLSAKPQRAVKKVPGIIDQQDINEAILDAATAIATATGALVQAAANAQQERVRLVRETPGGRKYMADPAWANGLISAAQNVAGSVTTLVKSANESVQGKAQEEALVASARAVATATAHLVAASRAKSDPDSKAQMNLKNAAKAVSNATSQLVSAANAAGQFQQEEEIVEEVDFATAGGKAKELEQQMKILRLEKDLEKARQGLNTMRKARYKKN